MVTHWTRIRKILSSNPGVNQPNNCIIVVPLSHEPTAMLGFYYYDPFDNVRLARWRGWSASDVGEATEALENELRRG